MSYSMRARGETETMRPREPEALPERTHGPRHLVHVRHPGEPANTALAPADASPAQRGASTSSASSPFSIDTDWTRILHYDLFAADGGQAVEAWVRHASAANGFGDAAADGDQAVEARPRHASAPNGFGEATADALLSSLEIYRAARVRRARFIGEAVASAIRAVLSAVREANTRRRRRRQANAIRDALYELDDLTLRDLGFHRSEIASVAAEVTGAAERTRMRSRSITTP